MAKKKKEINWSEIKERYTSSEQYTLRELASEYGISYQTIKRHSSQGKWGKERAANLKRIKEKIEHEQQKFEEKQEIIDFTYRDKINKIADKLLWNIEAAAEAYAKPSSTKMLTGALKDLIEILRDVNNQPTGTEQKKILLAQEKLKIEKARVRLGVSEENESGVVMLPEVTAADAAE